MKYKLFDHVWVQFDKILFPAVIWGEPLALKDGSELIDVLIVINGICLPRFYHSSRVIDAREDDAFSFSTKRQLSDLSQTTQRPSDTLFDTL